MSQKTKEFREEGGEVARGLTKRPHKFRYTHTASNSLIIVPRVSSMRREYIPFGFLDNTYIVSDAAQVIYDPEPYVFGVLSSRMHMIWVAAIAGRLKTDYRYSSGLCYNTFPLPTLSRDQKNAITEGVFRIIGERENHSESTLSQLYDPDSMPQGLLAAHRHVDSLLEQCFKKTPFNSDSERLEYLFAIYEKAIRAEESNGG